MFSCAWLLVGRGYSNRMIIIAANPYRHAFMRTCLPAYSTSHSHSYVDTITYNCVYHTRRMSTSICEYSQTSVSFPQVCMYGV